MKTSWRAAASLAVLALACGCGDSGGGGGLTIEFDDMAPTLRPGDRVSVEPFRHDDTVSRGDIIVFKPGETWGDPDDGIFVKRVIAVEGDTVMCCDSLGKVMLNGEPIVDPYVESRLPQTAFGAIDVPPMRLWVMGDNRGRSTDSRQHVSDPDRGTVSIEAVVGRIR